MERSKSNIKDKRMDTMGHPSPNQLATESANCARPLRQGTPRFWGALFYSSLRDVFDARIGFPASDPASAGRRCHRYAVREISRPGRTYQSSQIQRYGQSTQLRGTHQANEGDGVSAEECRRRRACRSAAHGGRPSAFRAKGPGQTQGPRLNKKPRRGLAGPLNPNMHIVL